MLNMRHAGRAVSDLSEAMKFYSKILGLEVVSKGKLDRYDTLKLLGVEDCDLTYVKLGAKDKNCLLELYYFENENFRSLYFNRDSEGEESDEYITVGFEHVSFTVDNIMDIHRKLVENGYMVMSSPSIDETCTHKLFFVRDNDGNLVELVEVI